LPKVQPAPVAYQNGSGTAGFHKHNQS
jgi:hypothetical protein